MGVEVEHTLRVAASMRPRELPAEDGARGENVRIVDMLQ